MLETDYLIIGSGAVGMAFADVLLTETEADLVMVDKYHKPGGHWNVAYPFVRLHQPSAFYGVSSTELGKKGIDHMGLNKGLKYLSSGSEILAYYDDVMQRQFLTNGRVKYFPLHNYLGDNRFESILTGKLHDVRVRRKVVNAAHMQTKVPATHTPNFTVGRGVRLIPINDLPQLTRPFSSVVVIGGGKTGIDAILWLLEHGMDPSKITWIKSRDAWFTNRKNTQPDKDFLEYFLESQASQFEALEQATSISDLFARLEHAGVLLRLDQLVRPTMYRGATVSNLELDQLRRVQNIVRLGRIKHIEHDNLHLHRGNFHVVPNTIFVDCSADALQHSEITDVFSDDRITLQPIRGGQIVFSAALIAHIEATYEDESHKNDLCKVVPLPSHDTDWIKMLAGSLANQHKWNKEPALRRWLLQNRLDGFSHLIAEISAHDKELLAKRKRIKESIGPAISKLKKFMAELD